MILCWCKHSFLFSYHNLSAASFFFPHGFVKHYANSGNLLLQFFYNSNSLYHLTSCEEWQTVPLIWCLSRHTKLRRDCTAEPGFTIHSRHFYQEIFSGLFILISCPRAAMLTSVKHVLQQQSGCLAALTASCSAVKNRFPKKLSSKHKLLWPFGTNMNTILP